MDPPEPLKFAGDAVNDPMLGLAAPTDTVTLLLAAVVPAAPDAVNVKVYVTVLLVLSPGNETVALIPVFKLTAFEYAAPFTFTPALGLTLNVKPVTFVPNQLRVAEPPELPRADTLDDNDVTFGAGVGC